MFLKLFVTSVATIESLKIKHISCKIIRLLTNRIDFFIYEQLLQIKSQEILNDFFLYFSDTFRRVLDIILNVPTAKSWLS